MNATTYCRTTYTTASQFVRSGAIQRGLIMIMRLLQLAWAASIVCLFTIILIQVLSSMAGYSSRHDMPICSDIGSLVMTATLLTYPPFVVLRAILIMAAPEYVPVADYLDHLKAKRLFCILLIFCSRTKPVNHAGIAICVVGIECEIDKVRRYISARDNR